MTEPQEAHVVEDLDDSTWVLPPGPAQETRLVVGIVSVVLLPMLAIFGGLFIALGPLASLASLGILSPVYTAIPPVLFGLFVLGMLVSSVSLAFRQVSTRVRLEPHGLEIDHVSRFGAVGADAARDPAWTGRRLFIDTDVEGHVAWDDLQQVEAIGPNVQLTLRDGARRSVHVGTDAQALAERIEARRVRVQQAGEPEDPAERARLAQVMGRRQKA